MASNSDSDVFILLLGLQFVIILETLYIQDMVAICKKVNISCFNKNFKTSAPIPGCLAFFCEYYSKNNVRLLSTNSIISNDLEHNTKQIKCFLAVELLYCMLYVPRRACNSLCCTINQYITLYNVIKSPIYVYVCTVCFFNKISYMKV